MVLFNLSAETASSADCRFERVRERTAVRRGTCEFATNTSRLKYEGEANSATSVQKEARPLRHPHLNSVAFNTKENLYRLESETRKSRRESSFSARARYCSKNCSKIFVLLNRTGNCYKIIAIT